LIADRWRTELVGVCFFKDFNCRFQYISTRVIVQFEKYIQIFENLATSFVSVLQMLRNNMSSKKTALRSFVSS